MPFFTHDGLRFHYLDAGAGLPVFWQHGLGGNAHLACELFKPPPGFRRLALDARGHGRTASSDRPGAYSFRTFAEDLRALMDHEGMAQAVIGGISMGAGVALHLALRWPERVLGLVLSRPAWLDAPHPWNVRLFTLVARLLREHGPQRGQALFQETEEYRETLRQWPDTAQSLALQFTAPGAAASVAKLEAFAHDVPSADRRAWARLRVPTLVLGNRLDPVHPFELAEELARGIPGAVFQEITSKSVSMIQHGRDVQRHVEAFLRRHFAGQPVPSPAS